MNRQSSILSFCPQRRLSSFILSPIITYFQTHSILTNKPNFENDKMNITLDMTSIYEILPAGSGQKTKPIQTQFKAWFNFICPKVTLFKLVQWSRTIITVYENRSCGENGNLWGIEKCYPVLNQAGISAQNRLWL